MRTKAGQKQIGLGLLICALFLLASSISILGAGNLVLSDLQAGNGSSASPGAGPSSMNGGNALWHFNYQAITTISTERFLSSPKSSPWLFNKTLFSLLSSSIAGIIICLIFSSRLAGSLCSQFSSIGITAFLHKKDGMK